MITSQSSAFSSLPKNNLFLEVFIIFFLIFGWSMCLRVKFFCRFYELVSEIFGVNENINEWSKLALDLYRRHTMCYESCKSWDDLAMNSIEGENCEGYSYWHWGNKGYKTIFDVLLVIQKLLCILTIL